MYKIRIITVILLLLLLNESYAQENTEQILISEINLAKTGIISEKQIKNITATEFPSLFPWRPKPEFYEEIFNEDMLRIKKLYNEYGYYDAKVDYRVKRLSDNRVEITIEIEQGDPIILRQIAFSADKDLPEEQTEEIKELISLKTGGTFSSISYQNTKNIIRDYFINRGYAKAEVGGEAIVNKKEKWADVTIEVVKGERYSFGEISIEGNDKIKTYIISREVLYKKGEYYSQKTIDDTRAKIFDLGFFRSVVVNPGFVESEKIVKTNIVVEERKFRRIKAGVGYGTEDLFRGQLIYSQGNFLGGGRNLEIAGKFSFLTQRLSAEFTQPYLFNEEMDFTSTLLLYRDDLDSYTSENLSISNRIDKQVSDYINMSLSYDLLWSSLSDISDATEEFIRSDDYFLTSLNLAIDRSTLDDPINPTRGTSLNFILESSLDFLGSDENYLKEIFGIKGFREFKGVVFAKRFDVGVIVPFGETGTLDVPIFKRFFAGGSTTMRGFPFQKLGPLASNEDPVGGNTILLGSLEARFPIYKKLGGVLFLDYGNVFPDEFDFKLDEIKYAIGTGLRYDTLIGPLRLDFGYTLNPEPGIDRFQFFLSIGHAF